MHTWILPEHIADLLPQEAAQLETMRRCMLDALQSHGYRHVMPPLLQYVESLQLDAHGQHAMQTFRLIDQLSGRQLGLRPDITPQAARIDAHLLNQTGITRLCYAGPVAHALPRDLLASREPFQIGAELFGSGDLRADLEIVRLMLETLAIAGVSHVHLDLGHVAIHQALLAGLDAELTDAIIAALHAKDNPSLQRLTAALPAEQARGLQALPQLYGGLEVLERARQALPDTPEVQQALSELKTIGRALSSSVEVRIDLAEQRVGAYHSGLVFAAYAEGWPTAFARGGRYDEVGRQFGRARPAVGFSLDARELLRVLPTPALPLGILAPSDADPKLLAVIAELRANGEIVIEDIANHPESLAQECDRQLAWVNGEWQVTPLSLAQA